MSKTIKRYWRRETIAFAILGVVAIALAAAFLSSTPTSAAPKKTKIDTPVLNCAGTATQASLNLTVCAPAGTGATGLPAGFSIHWTTAAALALGPDGLPGTLDDGTWPATDGVNACGASFSGNANLSRYNLRPSECVTINIGELLFDEGASTNCPNALTCGTDYVFRAFGHATSGLARSDFSANKTCATLECDQDEGCTFTQGYWKTHGPEGCNPSSSGNVWPVTGLTLGTVFYTDSQLCAILNTPAAGNGLLVLAHQLIAARLNEAAGADVSAIGGDLASADALIGGLVIPPVGAGSLPASATSALTTSLTNYNEGATGPGHCE